MKKNYANRNLALIFITVVINYLDRSNISIAANDIQRDFGFGTVEMGYIFSAFAVTYSVLQIPGGILVDKVSPKILYPVLLILWSLATISQSFVAGLLGFIIARAAIGIFESPSYPMNNKIVSSWFPESERAKAIAIYTSGQFIGLAFLAPVLVYVQAQFGWRHMLIMSGIVGIVWSVIWYFTYKDAPQTIEQSNEKKPVFEWNLLGKAFGYKQLWGIYLGQFCLGTIFIFFLTWFPTYLVKFRGLDFIKTGWLSSIPFIFAFFGVLFSGFISDYLFKKGHSTAFARKAPILVGMLLSIAILGANYTESSFWIIAFLSIAFFGNGLASINWVFVSLMSPPKMLGLVGGVFNFIGGLASASTPIIIGYLVKDGDFKPALIYIGMVALVGFFSYVFLVGKVERID